MNNQEILLKQIRKQLINNQSINDEIAGILNISYDAAHRRVSGKSKFSIDETVQLCNHYNLSMDNLFANNEKVIVQKTIEMTSLKDMKLYFEQSAAMIEKLTKSPDSVLYYSAKDIPLFYFMDNSLLSKFKIFVWLKLLNSDNYNLSFENFVLTESFMEHSLKLKKSYESVAVNEIWNDTTINSSLQQIQYFYEAGLVNYNNAKLLYEDLKRILDEIKVKINKENAVFKLYYNELILPNNNLLFETNNQLTLFVPYTLLGYFITNNNESCSNVLDYFKQQMANSQPLNQLGIKEQNLFFNKAIRKIDYYMDNMKNEINFQF
jgi:hypothetical protein